MANKKLNCGVYIIKNLINSRLYVGSSIDLRYRLNKHKRLLIKGTHVNKYLQRAWDKYGKDNFEFKIILFCSKERVLFYEQNAIDILESHATKNGYNSNPNAENSLGSTKSKEARLKMSQAWQGRVPWNKGIPCSEETKRKVSESKLGKKASEETKALLSKIRIGKKRSKETIEKYSLARQGHEVSNECRLKISQKLTGVAYTRIRLDRQCVMYATREADKTGIPFSYLPEWEHKRYKK